MFAEEFEDRGFIVRRKLFSEEFVRSLRVEAGDVLVRSANLLGLPPDVSRRDAEDAVLCLHQVHKLSEAVLALSHNPLITSILADLIGPDVKMVQTQLFYKGPGKPGNNWHQDEIAIPTRDRSLVGVWIAIDTASSSNGCLRVIPGSHASGYLYPRSPHGEGAKFDFPDRSFGFDESLSLDVEASPGDAIFFHGYLLHSSMPNESSDFRRAVTFHYMNAYSLFPWRIVAGSEGEVIRPALADYRDVVPVLGRDPYEGAGYTSESTPHLRSWRPRD